MEVDSPSRKEIDMRHEMQNGAGPRVFIAGLRSFEIVYLPATGQIVSRLSLQKNVPTSMEGVRSGKLEVDPPEPE
jgi:hypothetical protein